MASTVFSLPPQPGFSFENCKRNAFLAQEGYNAPKTTKTGTTIAGVIFKNGVVLGADTRATGGDVVCNKNCLKLHALAPNILCAGAGTAADCDKMTSLIQSQLYLHRLDTNRQSRVVTATTLLKQRLFQYQGHIGAYLIVGGVDVSGPHLNLIMAHGSVSSLSYGSLGSGMLAATSVLENRYKENMEEEEAKQLIHDAITAGIVHDMGSGSNVDIVVIKGNDEVEMIRPYRVVALKGERKNVYRYKKGATAILNTTVRPVIVESTTVLPISEDVMDVNL